MFVSGHLPFENDGTTLMTGRVSSESVPQGYQAARQCGLNIVATLQDTLGDLSRVKKVVKVCTTTRLDLCSAGRKEDHTKLMLLFLLVMHSYIGVWNRSVGAWVS